jgi:hypothetical protein
VDVETPIGPAGQHLETITRVLADADALAALPRLGGMARPDGIAIVSERYWAFAGSDGSLREGRMPAPPRRAGRIPLLRGLLRLAATFAPLLSADGIGRRGERWLLGALLTVPFTLFLLPPLVATVAEAGLTLALLCWLFRGRTLFLHGAEHRAIGAAEQRRLLATWCGQAQPSRYAARCGTNFAALVLPIAALLNRYWPVPTAFYTPFLVCLLALALTTELWRLAQTGNRWTGWLLLPGLALQRLTTQEPRLPETRLALTALATVLQRELNLTAAPAHVREAA